MSMFTRWSASVGMIVIACAFSVLHAQQQGGIPVRIDNEPDSKCINSATDKVWLTLYRVVESKKNGFFSKENQAEIVVTVKVQSDPQAPQALSFPLSTKVNIRPYGNGQISLPVEYTLVSGLNLQQTSSGNNVNYTGFSVDTTLVNVRSKGGLGSLLMHCPVSQAAISFLSLTIRTVRPRTTCWASQAKRFKMISTTRIPMTSYRRRH